jgi:transposase
VGEQRQRYNEDFKQETVRYIQGQTKTVTDIAQELDIPTPVPSRQFIKV